MAYEVTFIKECVPVERCGLAGIGSHTDHHRVNGYYWRYSLGADLFQ